jgi:Calx-beta domain/FG-GAP-like repeat
MNNSYRLAKLCSGLSFTAILFLTSLQYVVTAQEKETVEFDASPACQEFGLRNTSFFKIPSSASLVVTADFNNDGIPDIAAPMPDTNSIAIALGSNQTGFEAAREFIAGVSPQNATVGDFNRDGEIDLAVTSKTDQLVNILLGDGAGNFSLTDSYPVEREPNRIVAADFNSDGWLDLVIGNEASNSFSIYLGGANGFISANPATIALNGNPRAFAAADFDRDSKLDLITIAHNHSSESSIRLFKGNGQGAFTETLTLTTSETYSLASADFNNDNYPDFATMGYRDSKLRIFFNNHNGGFNAPVESNSIFNYFPYLPLTAGDLNGDRKIDLTIDGVIWLNDGNGNFTIREKSNAPSGDLAVADFNGDGIVDLAAAGRIGEFSESESYSTFTVSYGQGDVKFEAPTYLPQYNSSTSVVTADFNNDGRQDIAAASPDGNRVQVSFQNEDGSFSLSTPPAFSNGGSATQRPILAVGDFNNDGKTDLATFISWARTVYILTNNGNGQFTLSFVTLVYPPYGYTPHFIQAGDFNNDGKLDLVALTENAYIILLNDGNGGFTLLNPVLLNTQYEYETVAVGDFDADGKRDLAISRGSLSLLTLRGNGDGTFTNNDSYPMPAYISMMRSGDLNGDNRDDLIGITEGYLVPGTRNLVTLISNSNGGFTQTNHLLPGRPTDVAIGDFNGDSIKDYLVTNSPVNAVTLFAGNGNGSFTAQNPIFATAHPAYGAVAAADFNRDQKLDLVLVSRFAPAAVFYNNMPKSPCLSVNDVQITEGNSGTTNAQFAVSLSEAATQTVAIDYRVVGRSAGENSDYNGVTGRLEFPPGTRTQTISIPVRGDAVDEIDETFQLVLSNPSNASLIDTIGVGTIVDDDTPPTVGIGDVSVVEGSNGNPGQLIFNASLSSASGRKAKVGFSTLDGTAAAGSDFTLATRTLVFNEGDITKQVVIAINPDDFVEPDESFRIKLSNQGALNVTDDEAVGTIINDDIGGTVEFETTVIETSEANETATVRIRRAGGNAAGVILVYSTRDGTAIANRDYLPSSGKLVFGANETVKTFIIPILDDAIDESPVETVNLKLENISGGANLGQQSTAVLNLADNDSAPMLTLAPASGSEGNNGMTKANFNVRLLAISEQNVSVNFATVNGTATAPEDYQSVSGTLVFAPGETSKTISVLMNGDTGIEPDETFSLNLSSPVNVELQNAQAVGTIVNDDSSARRANGDFDGDGKTDVAVFRPAGGNWFYLQSSNSAFQAVQFGASGDRIVPGDYDGDGKADIAVFRPSTGGWYMLRSSDSAFSAVSFGISEDKPVAGDFDNDSKTDVAVFRPSTGAWYILRSSDNAFSAVQFGISEDKPVPADYDGDGQTDIAVFRPSTGGWYRLDSSNNQFVAVNFGVSEDKPVAADYDGDGRADIAVFRPSSGVWYLLQSTAGFSGVQWGIGTDLPAPGDYDGDGKSDIAVFRATDGNWYLNQSTGAQQTVGFGTSGDITVPSGYHP